MIHFLMKIYAEKQHADSFRSGELYANRLSWFREIEDTEGRGDEYEGAALLQRDNLVIHMTATNKETGEILSEGTITKDDLAAPPVVQLARFDDLNLFCMYAGHSNDFQPKTDDALQELKKHIEIPDHCLQLGRYAVLIRDAPEFFKRVQAAVDRQGYKHCGGLVEYYDPEIGTPIEQLSLKSVFRKRDGFADQREYRLVINTGTTGVEAIILNIGDITDITMLLDTHDVNRMMSIRQS